MRTEVPAEIDLARRRERMLAIAHPGHRAALEAAAEGPRPATDRRAVIRWSAS